MSSEHAEVRKLVDAIAKLVKPLLNKTVEKEVEKVPEVPAPAVVRQWQQGKGVVVVDDLLPVAAAVAVVEKAVAKVEKKPLDRLAKMLRDEPKPDKVAMALFGMQVRQAQNTARDRDRDRDRERDERLFSSCCMDIASHYSALLYDLVFSSLMNCVLIFSFSSPPSYTLPFTPQVHCDCLSVTTAICSFHFYEALPLVVYYSLTLSIPYLILSLYSATPSPSPSSLRLPPLLLGSVLQAGLSTRSDGPASTLRAQDACPQRQSPRYDCDSVLPCHYVI